MSKYDKEIDQLWKEIEDLDLERVKKETQLQQVLNQKQENKKSKESPVRRDKVGKRISKGDWVRAATPGKFVHNESKVLGFKSWVTFGYVTGVKQVRALHNLLLCDHDQKRNNQRGNTPNFNQQSCGRTDTWS